MTIHLDSNHPFGYEIECVIRIFFPGAKITADRGEEKPENRIVSQVFPNEDGVRLFASVAMGDFAGSLHRALEDGGEPDRQERELAALLFRLLCEKTGRRPPWGILTGVRPVRLVNTWLAAGQSEEAVEERLCGQYLVHPDKADLTLSTMKTEREILDRRKRNGFSLYIGIPFCPSRCLYCSFVSHDIEKAAKLVPDYLVCLCRELEEIGVLARSLGLCLQSIYIGGGTPTTLEPPQLERLLEAVGSSFDLSHLLEYTVEAGRPDTITGEKLEVMRKNGVDRISINPQTMDDAVLRGIGRRHTSGQVVESYHMARASGFTVVNMDLIAGLPGDTAEGFGRSLEQVAALGPENITVHTLTVKRSSTLRGQDNAFDRGEEDWDRQLQAGQRFLSGKGYRPYYLYRQKGTVQNLENVGYCLPGAESFYNALIMEEVHTVLAAGAGATTKLYAPPDKLRRVYNYKYPYEYIGRFDEMLARKASIKEFYEEL